MAHKIRIRIPRLFSHKCIAYLLDRAEKLGHSLDKNSLLEELTLTKLEQLVARNEKV